MNDYYVYIYFRKNGIPCYVGKGKGFRWSRHERYVTNKHLNNLIRLDGELPKIKIREGLTNEEAKDLEIKLIDILGRQDKGGILFNLTDGGDGAPGWKPSAKELKRRRNRKISKKTRNILSKNALKQFSDPEQRHKNSLAKRGNKFAVGNKSNSGRKFSEETKEKMRQAAYKVWDRRMSL